MSIYNQTTDENTQGISVQILSRDRTGLVSEISREISSLNFEIKRHNAKVFTDSRNNQMSVFNVCIGVDDESDIQTLLHRLHKIKGVVSVTAC